jgi:exodeoxyribonuclease V alpha subunit
VSVEAFDARLALRALPLLRTYNEAGVLSAADVHVAQRLGRLGGEDDPRVLLAAALAVRAVREGAVCITLAEAPDTAVAGVFAADAEVSAPPTAELPWPEPVAWEAVCRASGLVADGVDADPRRPLRWVGGRLYLDRYWRQEQVVRTELDDRIARPAPAVDPVALLEALARVFDRPDSQLQQLAAAVAAGSRITVLTGGPGTGKTTTVARMLAVLQSLPGGPARVALAAPTGKAAARLQEAVRAESARLPAVDRQRVGQPSASTVHRLLGWKPGSSTRFRHDRSNRLPHDLVVVDETSMVSLTLMSRLLEALRPEARLVLVGDPDQLASVEAGAVLGDLVARPVTSTAIGAEVTRQVPHLVPADAAARSALGGGIVRLQVVHRFGGAIAELATAIRRGDADGTIDVLTGNRSELSFVELADASQIPPEAVEAVHDDVVTAATTLSTAARDGNVAAALAALERHRLLLAHRRGPAGVARWTFEVERWLADRGLVPPEEGEWYRGRPLLVTANDRDTGLYNGDTGVVVDDGRGGVVVAFGAAHDPLLIRPHRLSAVQTVHAMTVHRGQGSQFAHVSLILPPSDSPLLTRELLYTAVTRAQEAVRVIGTQAAVRAAVERPVRRASGLRHPLPARDRPEEG